MSSSHVLVQRPPLVSDGELERIEAAMALVLSEHGISVPDEGALEQIRLAGFTIRGDRALIEPEALREFLDAERGGEPLRGPAPAEALAAPITVYASPYPQHVHDIDSDRVVPFTTEKLIEATKLVDVLAERGVVSSPPGCPADVPPALQPVLQYWVAATYSRQGKGPVDSKAEISMPYVMEMGEVLGHPVGRLPVYVFSPLTLGGESLQCVMKYRGRLSSVSVSSMPSAGCTVPIGVGNALAVAAAEVIGSAILARELTGLPVHWSVGLFPMDLHSLAMVFGSPSSLLFQLVGREVSAYLHGTHWDPAAGNIHTNAKLPGSQACAEKASLMTAGALLGQRAFGSAGTLSLDEVFSAEQLVYDLEIKDHVQRLVGGVQMQCDPKGCLAEVVEAAGEKSFLGLESTVDGYRDLYWQPRLFERGFVNAWMAEGAGSIRGKAHGMVKELLEQHEYRLEPGLQEGIDEVLERARRELGGDGR